MLCLLFDVIFLLLVFSKLELNSFYIANDFRYQMLLYWSQLMTDI